MGITLTEFVMEAVIRDGLGDLRANPAKLDDLFSQFKETQFNVQFGQTQIDKIKAYIQNNQIRIFHAFGFSPTKAPVYTIQAIRADEEEGLQQFNNFLQEEDINKTPTVFVPVVTPGTYDIVTGKLTVTNNADLSGICPGMIFVDSANTKFTIQSGNSNLSGNKFINIGKGLEPSLAGNGRIESSVDFQKQNIRQVRFRETISLGCHAIDDVHLVKYLYYILIYILKSRQESLVNRGIILDKISSNLFTKDLSFEGENWYTRFIEVTCITEFSWIHDKESVFDCFNLDIKTPTPDPNSTTAAKYNKSDN